MQLCMQHNVWIWNVFPFFLLIRIWLEYINVFIFLSYITFYCLKLQHILKWSKISILHNTMLYSIFLIAQGKCSELQEARKLLEIVGAMLGSYTDIPRAEGLLSSLPFLQYSTALKLNEAIRKWSLQDILCIQDLCDWLQTAQSTGECGVRRDFGSSLLETCSTQHSWKWMEDSKDTL